MTNTSLETMYRRRRRSFRRAPRSYAKSIQHVTASINAAPANNTATHHIMANAGAYSTTGTALTTVATALSNREQENTVGSKIGKTTIDLAFRNTADTINSIVDVVVWKRERQGAVPVAGTGLPSDANITSKGAQVAFREEMPGRVLHYSQVAISNSSPRVKKIVINWKKFRMQTIRTGDFYGVSVFNRGGGATFFCNIEVRYKEWM